MTYDEKSAEYFDTVEVVLDGYPTFELFRDLADKGGRTNFRSPRRLFREDDLLFQLQRVVVTGAPAGCLDILHLEVDGQEYLHRPLAEIPEGGLLLSKTIRIGNRNDVIGHVKRISALAYSVKVSLQGVIAKSS